MYKAPAINTVQKTKTFTYYQIAEKTLKVTDQTKLLFSNLSVIYFVSKY